jgi:hypothetical protein
MSLRAVSKITGVGDFRRRRGFSRGSSRHITTLATNPKQLIPIEATSCRLRADARRCSGQQKTES